MTSSKDSIFSPDRLYRYSLWRHFRQPSNGQADLISTEPAEDRVCVFIGLNPSTADEVVDDNTLRRCRDFAKRWGYTSLCMVNLFGLRATEPKVMMNHPEPVGGSNMSVFLQIAKEASLVVAAWGNDGGHLDQDMAVKKLMADHKIPLYHLGLTQKGFPFHPLYRKADCLPINWTNYSKRPKKK